MGMRGVFGSAQPGVGTNFGSGRARHLRIELCEGKKEGKLAAVVY